MKESLIFAAAFLAGCVVALLLRAVLYRPHAAEPLPATSTMSMPAAHP